MKKVPVQLIHFSYFSFIILLRNVTFLTFTVISRRDSSLYDCVRNMLRWKKGFFFKWPLFFLCENFAFHLVRIFSDFWQDQKRTSGGQNLKRWNIERRLFRNFEIANIKITKDELFDSFEFLFFIFNIYIQYKYIIIYQIFKYWFSE